jgi:hypothetical protein
MPLARSFSDKAARATATPPNAVAVMACRRFAFIARFDGAALALAKVFVVLS